jgi:hypothetical protein
MVLVLCNNYNKESLAAVALPLKTIKIVFGGPNGCIHTWTS